MIVLLVHKYVLGSFKSHFNSCQAGQAEMTLSHGQNILFIPTDITSIALLHIGLSPTDSFDEAIADMIVGGVEDFFQALIKVFMEKEEAKKVPNKHNFVFLFSLLYNLYHFSLQFSIPCSLLTFRSLLFATTFRSVPPVFAPLTACPHCLVISPFLSSFSLVN